MYEQGTIFYKEYKKQDIPSEDVLEKDLKDMLEIYEEEAGEDVEQEQIRKLLVKKHYDKDMEFKDKQKIMAFLLRRGYSMDSVRRAMDEWIIWNYREL